MSGGADGEEFGEAFDDAENQRQKIIVQDSSGI
jgi:hypothetical protein